MFITIGKLTLVIVLSYICGRVMGIILTKIHGYEGVMVVDKNHHDVIVNVSSVPVKELKPGDKVHLKVYVDDILKIIEKEKAKNPDESQ